MAKEKSSRREVYGDLINKYKKISSNFDAVELACFLLQQE